MSLCELGFCAECCQDGCGETRGLVLREKSYLLLLAMVSVQALASGRENLCILLSCDAGQEKLLKVRITIVFLDRYCHLLLFPSPSCLVHHLLKERSLHQVVPSVKHCLIICNVVFHL